jgi:hypothetical protein
MKQDAVKSPGMTLIPAVLTPLESIVAEVLANSGNDLGTLAHQREVVGDIGGGPPLEPLHRIDQERNAEDVHLVGKDVVLKMAREDHDVIVGDRSGDNDSHERFSSLGEIKAADD